MKFILTAQHQTGGEPWEEHYDKPELQTLESVEKWALYIVHWFNSTRRPGERVRKLISVRLDGTSQKHKWFKANLVTIMDPRLGIYDIMKCETCGVTGKRFRLNHDVKIDSKFRAKRYQTCTGEI